ncbi:MSCRAMM family protein [Levilactobacillus enshiensis]|uniref:MSCRAMM family protein n=1 Tax=Levilactobacillus enshiensis TaxID=2590213 RepID=UPI00117B1BD1|nr:SpaA isopeptide-forming pilin-related protein [Levilactobacillus enshiensis]
MKKWLRILFLVTCIIGLTSILRIQAHKREGIIQTAVLQDKAGGNVKEITSHQPADLQAAMTLELPAGDTVIALADQAYAKFAREAMTDLTPDQDMTAEVDQKGRLHLNNEQEQAQSVELVVPITIADPLLIDELQLKLQVVDEDETYDFTTISVKADNGLEDATGDSTRPNDKLTDNASHNSSKAVTSSSQSATKKAVSQQSQSAKQRSRSTKSKTPATTSKSISEDAADDDADADAEPATKVSRSSQGDDLTKQLTGPTIDITRGQVQIGSWSDELKIGGTLKDQSGVTIHEKSSGPDGKQVGGYYANEKYKTHYYVSYQQKNDAKSYALAFKDGIDLSDKTISVYYPEVGAYTAASNAEQPNEKMGAILEISNLVYSPRLGAGKEAYIDFSSNFYSGIVYNGIESFDLDITFTNEAGTRALNFPKAAGDDYKSYFTFGSLNGNDDGRHEWAGTKLNLPAKLSEATTVKNRGGGWYEGTGEGIFEKDEDGNYKPYTGPNQWGDFLGSTNYEKGAVSFPLVDEKHEFMLRSDAGFTWQSFSTGSIVPLKPEKPLKTVHRTEEFGIENNDLHEWEINRDEDKIKSFFYTVYQKTYSIPDESIAKPDRITLTDTLPTGMSTKPDQIVLYNTDGELLEVEKPEDRGKVEVNGQKVTYELSDKEIEMLDFNGDYFAIQIEIDIKENFVGTFKNKANVRFDSGVGYDWNNDTNEVVTDLIRNLVLRKLGDSQWDPASSERLKDVVFEIKGGDDQRLVTTDENGEIVLEKMDSKETYAFTERVPAGYVSPQKFTVAYNEDNQRWEITGDSTQVAISSDDQQVITVTNKVERGGFQFKKVDGTDDQQLAGAEFIIRSETGKYLKFDDDGRMVGTVATPENATKLTSLANQATKVTGLPYGKYQLIEAKAPDGYVIGQPYDFTVTKESGSKVIQIKNDPYSLPVTGGQGILWLIGLGLILTLSALAIWRTHPRGG